MNATAIKKVNELLDQKFFIAQIAQQLDLPAADVAKIEKKRRKKLILKNKKEALARKNKRQKLIEKIIKLYQTGLTKQNISIKTQQTLSTIDYALKDTGLVEARAESEKKQRDKRTNNIASLYQSGLTIQQIAQKTDYSESIIRYALQDKQLIEKQIRKQPKEITQRIKKIHALHKKGIPKKQIAIELNCARGYVSHTLRGDTQYQDKKVALRDSRIKKIIQYKSKNMDENTIAEKLKISLSTVRKYYAMSLAFP
ncbi:hypothetical protein [Marinicellulosiphila megalodicopiae]|uniref:hypothetical protein n=1 Tax=Marinicellulosiphila megalodicopiae TaxID=2724896 RepID=UPI003BB21957